MDDKLIECQSRSALYGLSSGALVFCSLYFVQKRATKGQLISKCHFGVFKFQIYLSNNEISDHWPLKLFNQGLFLI